MLGTTYLHSQLKQEFFAVNVSVLIAALTFVGILVYHFCRQAQNTKQWRKVANLVTKIPFMTKWKKPHEGNEFESDMLSDERDHLLPQMLPPANSS